MSTDYAVCGEVIVNVDFAGVQMCTDCGCGLTHDVAPPPMVAGIRRAIRRARREHRACAVPGCDCWCHRPALAVA